MMIVRKTASAWRYSVFTLPFLLVACEESDQVSQLNPLETVRQQQAESGETTGSVELAQATDPADESQQDGQQDGQSQTEEPAEQDGQPEAPEIRDTTEPPDTEASDDPAEAQDQQQPVGTFTPNVEDREGIWESRLPDDERTILIPATTLFPGNAIVEHNIENPYSGDTEAIAAGERHFAAYNCAGCHAPLGGGGMGPPLSDDEWIYGGEPAQIYLSIMHGRGDGMPAWASMLPRKTAWEIVAYVETLSDIEDYAAEAGFEENVGGFRQTQTEEQNGDEGAEPQTEAGSEGGE